MTEYRITGGTDDTDFGWQPNLSEAVSDWTDNPIVPDEAAWERCAEDQPPCYLPALPNETTADDIYRAEQYMAAVVAAYASIDSEHASHVTMNGFLDSSGGSSRAEYHRTELNVYRVGISIADGPTL